MGCQPLTDLNGEGAATSRGWGRGTESRTPADPITPGYGSGARPHLGAVAGVLVGADDLELVEHLADDDDAGPHGAEA